MTLRLLALVVSVGLAIGLFVFAVANLFVDRIGSLP